MKPSATFIDPSYNNDDSNELIDYSFVSSDDLFKDSYYNDESIEIKERSLKFFSNIITHEPVKRFLFRALLRQNRNINVILVGPAANGKTLFMKAIYKGCNKVLFYDASTGSTGAGLIQLLRYNLDTKILIIDEISELRKNEIDMLRGLANDGSVNKALESGTIDFKIENLKIFATTNNPTKLSEPIKSRFQMYHIPAYSDKEFIDVMNHCLVDQHIITNIKLANQLANAMVFYNIKNTRVALSLCSLIHDSDNTADIKYIIENYLKYDASRLNINYNKVSG